jgi:hypothetical protein
MKGIALLMIIVDLPPLKNEAGYVFGNQLPGRAAARLINHSPGLASPKAVGGRHQYLLDCRQPACH